jgi:dCTP deaminase
VILSGFEIMRELGVGLDISPFKVENVNPNSYDVELHNELLVYDKYILDSKDDNATSLVKIPESGIILYPGKLYLGRTSEYTNTTQFAPMLSGRSSLGRLGLAVHVTAGFGDVGFIGHWTLELCVVQPIRIYAGTKIAQLHYYLIDGDYETYKGKYHNNLSIQSSKLFEELK